MTPKADTVLLIDEHHQHAGPPPGTLGLMARMSAEILSTAKQTISKPLSKSYWWPRTCCYRMKWKFPPRHCILHDFMRQIYLPLRLTAYILYTVLWFSTMAVGVRADFVPTTLSKPSATDKGEIRIPTFFFFFLLWNNQADKSQIAQRSEWKRFQLSVVIVFALPFNFYDVLAIEWSLQRNGRGKHTSLSKITGS